MDAISLQKHWAVLFLILSFTAVVVPEFVIRRWHIHVVNGLDNGKTLFVHCKSKDDDLGPQNLTTYGAEFTWTFRVNFWDTTLYWCYLRKPNAQVSFDAFWVESKSIWLWYKCYERNCYWTGKDDGVYIKNNPDNRDVLVHKWEPLSKF